MILKKIKNINKNKIGINIMIISLSISGLLSITSGAVLNKLNIKPKNKVKIKIVEKQVPKKKSNIPTLKEITVEVNEPISVNINDYIENLDDIEPKVLKKFKLDTSLVNVTQAGNYNYTISYKDKKYNGTVTVKEKELPIINNMTLKEISLELGSKLPQNLNDYVVESIPEEAKNKVVINLSKVNTNMAGTYQYTVTYKDKIYTGNIIIYESQPQIITPEKKEEEEKKPEPTEPTNPPEQSNDNNTQQP